MKIVYILEDDILFSPEDYSIEYLKNNRTMRLGSNECQLLLFLINNKGKVLERETLIHTLWKKKNSLVEDSSLTQSVSTLRRILKDNASAPKFIKTIPKHGYIFISKVTKTDEGNREKISNNKKIDYKEGIFNGALVPQLEMFNKKLLRHDYYIMLIVFIIIIKDHIIGFINNIK
ncbi:MULTISPECIES: winged helix-turn-helix domain-containing protein [unclassified Vibrio]|uniref:winged helix-turn-helix domain-containing protein n=1 Tax=unclassified Vibrio TaxID=2614977 RepID=UPI001F38141E|nr:MULTISPECIES: winged helix-turn-helix domain-containing protein [unclassified Vibrio]QXL80211.1 Transcriptional activator CadC [Vibrio sp.]